MLENLYTTKMSADKKKMQNRFTKIRSKSGVLSKFASVISFAAVLSVILCVSVAIAVNTDNNSMSQNDFYKYINRHVGSIMAELDYVDDEKAVFHYLDGFFVYNLVNDELEYSIDLSKLNCAPHQQGSYGIDVTISEDGKKALLVNYGSDEEIKDFDNYIINLDSGKVRTTSKDELNKNFASLKNISETYSAVPDAKGWFSDTCITVHDGSIYYLTCKSSDIKSMLLCRKKADGTLDEKYIFDPKMNNTVILGAEDIKEITEAELEIYGLTYTLTDTDKLIRLEKMLSSAGLMKNGTGCPYDATLYLRRKDGTLGRISLASDNCDVYYSGGRYYKYADGDNSELLLMFDLVQFPVLDDSYDESLYSQTSHFLMREFIKAYGEHYDILDLEISEWKENGNEAVFWYKMTYQNYNRNPDKAKYIQEAKGRSKEEYDTLYKDYLETKSGSYHFKVILNGEALELYADTAPKGSEWQKINVGEWLMNN